GRPGLTPNTTSAVDSYPPASQLRTLLRELTHAAGPVTGQPGGPGRSANGRPAPVAGRAWTSHEYSPDRVRPDTEGRPGLRDRKSGLANVAMGDCARHPARAS